jgi:RND superfamily putative drug exporter
MNRLYIHLAFFAIRRRKWVIGCWLLFAAFSLPLAAKLPDVLGDHGLVTDGLHRKALARMEQEFGIPAEPVLMLFESAQEMPAENIYGAITQLLQRADRISGVDVAASPLLQSELQSGSFAYAVLSVPESIKERRRAVEQLRGLAAESPDGLKVYVTGKPVVQEDVNRSSREDLSAAEMLGVPVAFAIMLLTFGGALPSLIPLLAGGIAVAVAMAAVWFAGAYGNVPLSVFVYNVIPMTGMAVCLDFALLMVSRFREEKASHSLCAAVCRTMATSGKSVTVSAVCAAAALAGTFFIRMPIFNTVALGALMVLGVSALLNLTLVPAMLYAWGDRIRPLRTDDGRARKRWDAWIARMMKRPGRTVLLSMSVLLLLLIPVREMRVSIPGPGSLSPDTPSRIAAERIDGIRHAPFVSEVYFVAEGREKAAELRSELLARGNTAGVYLIPSPKTEDVYLITVRLRGKPASAEVMQWVREQEKRHAADGVLIGGEPKYEQEVQDAIFSKLPHVAAFVTAANYAVLAIALRSLLIPAKAILMNLLSLGASFGILVWLFQGGKWGLEATDIAIMIPVFLFGLVFGISMDYGIFLLSRICEAYRQSGDTDLSVREGLLSSGKIITSAAAIMIAVTAPFALAGVSGVKQLGIGIAAALLIDATLIRLTLVPALMKLIGKWNWWMPRLG